MTTSVQMFVLAAAASACATGAVAQPIAIANPSFELPAMPAGGFTSNPPDGWSHGGGGTIGVFYPTVGSWGYTAPQGNQVGYTNSGVIEQTLSETVRPDVEYILMVDIVHRPRFYQTYKVELLAGDTVVAIDDGTLDPPEAGFLVCAVRYEAAPGDPLIGEPLKIRLSGPSQANFDNVRISTCSADLDADGALTFFDFLAFQNLFSRGDLLADFSGDGALDFFDFLTFQNAFSAGCA